MANLPTILFVNYVTGTPIPLTLASYTIAAGANQIPSAVNAIGQLIYVSDESGGAVPAFSDGTNWRRVTDRAIIS